MKHIPLEDCVDRQIYQIFSRNLRFGAFRKSSSGFIGIRLKFGERYLFEEYHYDTGPPHGTVQPLKAMNLVVPEEILLQEHLDLVCSSCERPAVQYRGNSFPDQPPGPPFYRHVDEPDGVDVCTKMSQTYGRAHLASNTALFDLLNKIEGDK